MPLICTDYLQALFLDHAHYLCRRVTEYSPITVSVYDKKRNKKKDEGLIGLARVWVNECVYGGWSSFS
jgi:hypothetical protein